MKKIMLALMLSGAFCGLKAQTLTVTNLTDCQITYTVIASNAGSCNQAYTSAPFTLNAGDVVNYNNTTSLGWSSALPPTTVDWSAIIMPDNVAGVSYGNITVGDPCTAYPTIATFTSTCLGRTIYASYSVTPSGDVTVSTNY